MSSDTVILSDGRDPEDETTRTSNPFSVPELQSAYSVIMVFVDNPNALHFELPMNTTLVMGRRSEKGTPPDIDLAPYGGFPAGVSRHHLRISRTTSGVTVVDLMSTNGTFINGEHIPSGTEIVLSSGQSLRVAQLHGWVYFEH